MKRAILILLILCLVGCTKAEWENLKRGLTATPIPLEFKIDTESHLSEAWQIDYEGKKIFAVQIDGHKYLMFCIWNDISALHAADCPNPVHNF